MTKRLDPAKGAGDRLVLEECFTERLNNAFRDTDLLIERSQDVFARDWSEFAENYRRGRLGLYAKLALSTDDGDEHSFSFIVVKQGVVLVGQDDDFSRTTKLCSGAKEANAISQDRSNIHKIAPVLVGVGDLVDTPEGVISSGVWSLGYDQIPLLRRQFLFYCPRSGIWDWKWLPVVHAPKWEPYARCASAIEFNERHQHLIERRSQMSDGLHNLKGDIVGRGFLAACHVMNTWPFSIDSKGVRMRGNVGVDSSLEMVEFALSSFDLFV